MFILISSVLFVFSPIYLCSQNVENTTLKQQTASKKSIHCLTQILIEQNQTTLDTVYQSKGITLKGLDLSSKQEIKLVNQLFKEYVGKSITENLLTSLKHTLIEYYTKFGRPFIHITFPEQELTDGKLHVKILEAHIGKVTVQGNHPLKTARSQKTIQLQEGDLLRSDVLVSDLEWINRNPFKTARASYSPGKEVGTTDVNIYIEDKKPFRTYLGTDNTGFEETGYERLFIGFNWGNFLNLDQVLSYQFTSSSDFKKFRSHMAFYTIPLPWKHELRFFGGYSHVKVHHLNHQFSTTGNSGQVSTRYEIPLTPFFDLVHAIRFGVDFRRTNNNLDFGGVRISRNDANIFQYVLGYKLDKQWAATTCFFDIEGIFSPGATLPHMSNQRFQQLRPNTRNQYLYLRALYEQVYRFSSGERLKFTFKGQLSTQFLLPSEQFGLGGLYSVRGYRERVINADNGMFLSLEGMTRPLHLLEKSKDQLQLIVFVDYGLGGGQLFLPDQKVPTSSILGIGPGVHYQIGDWMIARAYWGIQVIASPRTSQHENHFNFSVMCMF